MFVFEKVSGSWSQTAKIASPADGAMFGYSVAVQGDVVLVAAPGALAAFVYQRVSGVWQRAAVLQQATPVVKVALQESWAMMMRRTGPGLTGAMEILRYQRQGAQWTLTGYRSATMGSQDNPAAVALSNTGTIVTGYPSATGYRSNTGAANLYCYGEQSVYTTTPIFSTTPTASLPPATTTSTTTKTTTTTTSTTTTTTTTTPPTTTTTTTTTTAPPTTTTAPTCTEPGPQYATYTLEYTGVQDNTSSPQRFQFAVGDPDAKLFTMGTKRIERCSRRCSQERACAGYFVWFSKKRCYGLTRLGPGVKTDTDTESWKKVVPPFYHLYPGRRSRFAFNTTFELDSLRKSITRADYTEDTFRVFCHAECAARPACGGVYILTKSRFRVCRLLVKTMDYTKSSPTQLVSETWYKNPCPTTN